MRLTIGLKIFSISIGLLALMAVVATMTTRLANDVGGQLQLVTERYIPTFGALARANVRCRTRLVTAPSRDRLPGNPF